MVSFYHLNDCFRARIDVHRRFGIYRNVHVLIGYSELYQNMQHLLLKRGEVCITYFLVFLFLGASELCPETYYQLQLYHKPLQFGSAVQKSYVFLICIHGLA
jgi:hypothetical protein